METQEIKMTKQQAAAKAKDNLNQMVSTVITSFASKSISNPLGNKGVETYLFNDEIYTRVAESELDKDVADRLNEEGICRLGQGVAAFNKLVRESRVTIVRDSVKPGKFFDDAHNYLAFKNGVLKISDRSHLSFSEAIPVFNQVDFSFNPNAECPLWEKAISEIYQDDSEMIELLQESVGYCFLNDCRFKKAFFLLGTGGNNGKSLIIDVIGKLLSPKNVSTIPFSKMNDPAYLARIKNKLANLCGETSINRLVDNDIFKAWSSGDSVDVKPLYVDPHTIRPVAKQFWATNGIPKMPTDPATINRCLFIVHDRVFKDHEQDKELGKKLESELDGIFNWALRGLDRLLERGCFLEPERSKSIKGEFVAENDSTAAWFEEEFSEKFSVERTDASYLVPKSTIYNSYKDYCEENKLRAKGNKEFAKRFLPLLANKVPSELRGEFNHLDIANYRRTTGKRERVYPFLRGNPSYAS
jgi:P4 family phage/plasmid primase-like protien